MTTPSSLTGAFNTDLQVLIELDDVDLEKLCQINVAFSQLCASPELWRAKIIKKFGEQIFGHLKNTQFSPKEFYLRINANPSRYGNKLFDQFHWGLNDPILETAFLSQDVNLLDINQGLIAQHITEYLNLPIHLIPDSKGQITIKVGVFKYTYPQALLKKNLDVIAAINTIMQTSFNEQHLRAIYKIPYPLPLTSEPDLESVYRSSGIAVGQPLKGYLLMGDHLYFEGLYPTTHLGLYEVVAGS